MKIFLIPFLICALISCDQSETSPIKSVTQKEDSVRARNDSIRKAQLAQLNKAYREKKSPVVVVKAYITRDEYGSKDLNIMVKNVGKRPLDAIQIDWSLYDNFGRAVDVFHKQSLSQDILKPGRTASYTVNLYASTATKAEAWIVKTHDIDGDTWEIKK